MSKLMKFFITCAAVFVVGLVMLIAGIGTGGVEGLDKVAEDHDWVSGSPGDRASIEVNDLDFESIEATGYMDVILVGPGYYDDVVKDYELETITEAEAGTALAIFGSNLEGPTMEMDDKTLKLSSNTESADGVNLNFSSENSYPTVFVFCSDKEIKRFTLSSSSSDVSLLGVSVENADIQLNYGDVEANNIVSKSMKIKIDSGDIELSGELKGTTDVSTDSGDIELSGDLKGTTKASTDSGDIDIDTKMEVKEYSMKVSAAAGDVTIEENEIEYNDEKEGYRYTQEGGEDTLILKTEAGDVKVRTLGETDAVEL